MAIAVDELITKVSLRPTIRGLYFYLAEKVDKNGYYYFPYKEAKKIIRKEYYKRYIGQLELLGLLEKRYKYNLIGGQIKGRRNRIKIIIKNQMFIPDEVVKIADKKNLTLKEKGIYFTLFLLKNKYGEIHGTVMELSDLFGINYRYVSGHFRVLESLDLIKRKRGYIKVLDVKDILV